MKLPLETLIGTGWDQLLAMLTVGGMIAAAILFGLRWRLGGYFVTKADHAELRRKIESDHISLTDRLKRVEVQVADSASARDVQHLAQRVEGVELGMARNAQNIADVKVAVAGASEKIGGVADAVGRVEHMMTLLVQHQLDKSK